SEAVEPAPRQREIEDSATVGERRVALGRSPALRDLVWTRRILSMPRFEAYRHAAFPRLLATLSLSADSAAGKRFSARHPLVDLLARLSAQWAIRAASTGLLLLGLQPSATAQSAGWTQWFPAQTPRSKYYVMSAVNPETNRLVAYGGYASPGPTP